MKEHFLLDPSVTFLNFGSFGACPVPVFESYQNWQRQLEREPVQFIAVHGAEYMKTARQALGAYVGADPECLVFTANPSYAGNLVASNFKLQPGDEVLSTDLEYGAMDRTWNYFCRKAGARFVRQPIRFPIVSKQDFLEQFWQGYSDKTKMVFISHITSATALILPVAEICTEARKRGLVVMIDGAHVPGHIPLNIGALDVDYYTGACHKWMMTPKGSSFLYVRESLKDQLEPLIISWGYESDNPSGNQFIDYHQFNGTRDFTACLTIPDALRFMEQHNWPQVASRCRKLVLEYAPRFCELTGMPAISPLTEEWIGQMFSIPVQTDAPQQLQAKLFSEYKIEIPVTRRGSDCYLRYSINAYNTAADLENLYAAAETLLAPARA